MKFEQIINYYEWLFCVLSRLSTDSYSDDGGLWGIIVTVGLMLTK